ncbi:esterase FE4-like [Schistocerca americana]|uniref:esterase FE4-like n=1 Tax=Schistocerca americana TaxID=7009 RepID=UPI001F4FD844|nr:esterase FE4-like [Schistocerca americana]
MTDSNENEMTLKSLDEGLLEKAVKEFRMKRRKKPPDGMNADGGPLVKTEGGQVRGRIATSFTGRRYASFQGIPYASPPVRNLRFKLLWHVSLLLAGRCYQRLCAPQAPQAAEPWQGVLNASAPGHGCPQLDHRSGCVVGHEDCLTLNVYTTQLEGKPQPVLVWVHGGSFANGSSRLYQPDVLLDQQLVVVTLNYRLGALGFLCWPRAGVPGNMGLRDQSLALYWVRRNIAAFGGDAGCVTLAGQSAGAASVIFHMLSPLSKGLFDRALCMSGSALCSWATPPHPEQRALRLLRAAGLPTHLNPGAGSDAAAVAAFLAGPGAAPDVLVPRYYDALDPQEPVEPMLPVLAACVETEAEACVGAFLPDAPSRLLAAGRVHRVPLLAGLTDGEANFLLLRNHGVEGELIPLYQRLGSDTEGVRGTPPSTTSGITWALESWTQEHRRWKRLRPKLVADERERVTSNCTGVLIVLHCTCT